MTVIFINGSFGVGKTSTVRALKPLLGGRVYDPEICGSAIRRLPRWLRLTNQNSGDYQDMPLWRKMTAHGIHTTRLLSRVVLVPMTFSNRAYLAEIIERVRRFDPDVWHFCLVAPLATVEERLRQRGDAPQILDWALRRARECCAAHESDDFSIRLDASSASPAEIAAEIAGRLLAARRTD